MKIYVATEERGGFMFTHRGFATEEQCRKWIAEFSGGKGAWKVLERESKATRSGGWKTVSERYLPDAPE